MTQGMSKKSICLCMVLAMFLTTFFSIMARATGPIDSMRMTGGLSFGTNVRVVDDSTGADQWEVASAVNKRGALVAEWVDLRSPGERCAYSSSQDGGATWRTNGFRINPKYSIAADPTVVADDNGDFYMLCMSVASGYNGGVLEVSKSTDDGMTWGPWYVAYEMPMGGFPDKPWMASYGIGKLYVVYEIFINYYTRVQIVRSTDGGVTWSPPMNLSTGGSSAELGAGVDTDAAGNVFVSWAGYSNLPIKFVKSTDGGVTWTPEVQVGTNGASVTISSIAVERSGKHAYIIWNSAYNPEGVWLSSSSDSGATWSSSRTMSPNGNKAMIDVDTLGTVHVIWEQDGGSASEVWYSNSTDNGTTFSSPARVPDQMNKACGSGTLYGSYESIISDESGELYAFWCDDRNGDADIYFAKSGSGAPKLARIDVTPVWANITADLTQQFNAEGYDTNGNKTNINPTWAASGGSVSSSGFYTPGPVGAFTVYANQSGISGTAMVTVIAGALASIDVAPKNPTITVEQTQQFDATGKDSKGNAVVINSFNWSASSGNVSSNGLYTPPTKPGSYAIWANASGKSGATGVNVTPGAVSKITISPKTASITVDQTQQYMALAQDKYGNPVSITPAWSATGGSISTGGLYSPDKIGTFTITVSSGIISDTGTITVTVGTLFKITIDPPAKTMTADETAQFIAKGTDSKGNDVSITPVWSVTGGSILPSGLYTPVQVGSFGISATQGGVTGTASVTVKFGELSTLTIDPTDPKITVDQTQKFTVKGFDAKGNELQITPSWSTDEGLITQSGIYTPTKIGKWKVTATVSSMSESTNITVGPGRLKRATVAPTNASLKIGDTRSFSVRGYDSKGNELSPLSLAWSVSSDVGSVDQNGNFTASKAGQGKVVVQVSLGQDSLQVQSTVTVRELSAGESLVKVFGGETNLYLFIILVGVLVVILLVILMFHRRKKRWQQEYNRTMYNSQYPAGMDYQQMPPPGAPPPMPEQQQQNPPGYQQPPPSY